MYFLPVLILIGHCQGRRRAQTLKSSVSQAALSMRQTRSVLPWWRIETDYTHHLGVGVVFTEHAQDPQPPALHSTPPPDSHPTLPGFIAQCLGFFTLRDKTCGIRTRQIPMCCLWIDSPGPSGFLRTY